MQNGEVANSLEIPPDECCEQELIAALPTIRRIARRIGSCSRSITSDLVDDLVQTGAMEFVIAYRNQHAQSGLRQTQYAILRSRHAMYEYLRSSSPNKRTLRNKAKRLNFVSRHLSVLFGRQPTEAELADTIGMELWAYREMLATLDRAGLVETFYLRQTQRREAAGSTDAPDPDRNWARNDAHAVDPGELRQAVADLPERERAVIELRYLSEAQEIASMQQVGERLGFQRSYVSKLQKRALRRLGATLGGGRSEEERRSGKGPISRYCRPSLERASE